MMNKQDIYDFLKEKGIRHEVTEHEAVFSMEELDRTDMPHKDCLAKNLFVRDDKKENHYLITVKGERRVDLKEFRKEFGLRHLSFAPEEDLLAFLGVHPGSVSPFGLLNDGGCKVRFFIDRGFFDDGGIIGIHPNDNTATVWMNVNDLLAVIKEHGNEIQCI